jgi:ABC-type microcin C transport system permease subunit YejE
MKKLIKFTSIWSALAFIWIFVIVSIYLKSDLKWIGTILIIVGIYQLIVQYYEKYNNEENINKKATSKKSNFT